MIWLPCEKECQPRDQYACRGDERAQEYIREEGEENEKIIITECGNCGHIGAFLQEEWTAAGIAMDRRAQKTGKASLTRYPRIETHTGEVVTSREHEKETLKRMGFHSAEHGLDEKFNSEASERLKSKNQALKDRKNKIRKKRESLMREGVIRRPSIKEIQNRKK